MVGEARPAGRRGASLIAQVRPVAKVNEYLGKVNGQWMAVPTSIGSGTLPPCARISMLQKFAGIDVRAWYPAHPSTPEAAADWTYATQLKAAEACFKAGYPFAIGCGGTPIRSRPGVPRSARSGPIWLMARATSSSIPTM